MDEPTEGLAPNIVLGLVDLLHRLREAGMAVLLVEQNLGFALDCADYVYVLNKGVIVYEGSAAAFREHGREVQERYLGI
jgi:branched-chain amino acid transport system ATP-binding protein